MVHAPSLSGYDAGVVEQNLMTAKVSAVFCYRQLLWPVQLDMLGVL
jgi:hypothetical protein